LIHFYKRKMLGFRSILHQQQRSLSYVSNARLLQKLKEDNSFCEEQLNWPLPVVFKGKTSSKQCNQHEER